MLGERRSVVLLFTFVLIAFAAVSVHAADDGPGWGYTSAGGQIPPVDWGKVASVCRNGDSQSPIAIGTFEALPGDGMSAPHIDYGTSDLVVFNNGHTIEAEVHEGAGEIELDGTTYELLQFHIHYGSEHIIDGNIYRAEIHLVHADADGNLAVLGSLLTKGGRSAKLNPFFRAAKRVTHKDDETEVHDFDLNRLVPKHASGYYHYSGSLTTPPCSEGVFWWIWDASRSISRSQLGNIKLGIPRGNNPQGNRRPVQSRNGRNVYHVGN